MCGIFGLIGNNTLPISFIQSKFIKGEKRGPETSILKSLKSQHSDVDIILGFHRLAINGFLNPASEQPIKKENCVLICNGEIYNWTRLAIECDVKCDTGSDCEIIIHLYKKYGAKQTLQMLDGVFAFILYDQEKDCIFIARDSLGVRPMFIWEPEKNSENSCFGIASEVKMANGLLPHSPKPFLPGHFIFTSLKNIDLTRNRFYDNNSFENNTINSEEQCLQIIKSSLQDAVRKRVDNTDREIACLLSGGLDSSLVTALVVKEYVMRNGITSSTDVHTWSIGMEGSDDLKYARMVANHLRTTHHEIKLSEKDFIDAIPEVIYTIETNDTTSIRASVGNYLICKHIREFSNAKVIFNGDGSDEVTGGYLYFHCAPDSTAFDKECRRLLNDIHLFDVLRSDRTISCHGLEARTPFLDRNFVQSYLSMPRRLRYHPGNKQCEKYLLRKAFSNNNLLPDDVLWRTKEAFSDGVSKKTRSWFEIIQDYASKLYNLNDKKKAEQLYYDKLFTYHYGELSINQHIIPYKWMPKFIEADDCSARTLTIYDNVNP